MPKRGSPSAPGVLLNTIKHIIFFREKLLQEIPDNPSVQWSEIVEWVFQNRSSYQDRIADFLKPDPDGSADMQVTEKDIRAEMKKPMFSQRFAVVRGLSNSQNRMDKRCAEYALRIIDSRPFPSVPLHALVTPILMHSEGSQQRESRKKRKTGVAHFPLPYPRDMFQKLLFLMSVSRVWIALCPADRRRGQKKHVRTRGDAQPALVFQDIPELPSVQKGANVSTLISSIVNIIYGAWNGYAQWLGFDSVEVMLSPYLVLADGELFFSVLLDKAQGFAPASQRLTFEETDAQTSSTLQAATFPEPTDALLRGLADLFLKDIFTATTRADIVGRLKTGITIEEMGRSLSNFFRASTENSSVLPPRFGDEGFPSGEEHISQLRNLSPRHSSFTSAFYDSRAAKDILTLDEFLEDHGSASEAASSAGNSYRFRNREPLAKSTGQKYPLEQETPSEQDIQPTDSLSPPPHPPNEECDDCQKAMEEVYSAMCEYCCIPIESDFRDLAQEISDDILPAHFKNPLGGTQLILTDPPFNTRSAREMTDSDHDRLSKDDMTELVRQAKKFLQPGGHAIIFCAAAQFSSWKNRFTEDEEFSVDPVPLICIPPGHNYPLDPTRKNCTLRSVATLAVHAYKKGGDNPMEMVNYESFNHVPSSHPAWTNVIDNVPRLAPGEQLRTPGTETARSRPLRPEQKCIPLLKELIARFSNPGDLVVDFFAGTFSTAIACVTLDKPRQFIGCEKMSDCFEIAYDNLKVVYAHEVLSGSLKDIHRNYFQTAEAGQAERIKKAARLVVQHRRVWKHRIEALWSGPEGFPHFNILPDHITRFLATHWRNPDFLKFSNQSVCSWDSSLRGLLNSSDPKLLVEIDAAARGLFIAPSKVRHKEAGNGLFALSDIRAGTTLGHYYGTLVYNKNLLERKEKTKSYASGIMAVSVDRLSQHHYIVETKFQQFKQVYLVGAPFCCFSMVNDAGYWEGDEDTEKLKKWPDSLDSDPSWQPRRQNIKFEQTFIPRRAAELRSPFLYKVVSTRNIECGEELFTSYSEVNQ